MTSNTLYEPKMAFHPGDTLQEKLDEMQMSVAEFSKSTSIPTVVIEEVLKGDISVSAEMAIAFEQVTEIPATWWLQTQHTYDDYALKTGAANYKSRLSSIGAQLSRFAASVML